MVIVSVWFELGGWTALLSAAAGSAGEPQPAGNSMHNENVRDQDRLHNAITSPSSSAQNLAAPHARLVQTAELRATQHSHFTATPQRSPSENERKIRLQFKSLPDIAIINSGNAPFAINHANP
jgi:hypothetical protein